LPGVAAVLLIDTIKNRLTTLLTSWKPTGGGKSFTLSAFIDFARTAIEQAMDIVAPLTDGATKKALVLDFAGKLFDAFAPLIMSRLPAWLRWLAFLFGGEDLRDEFLSAVTVLIEVIFVEKFKPTT